MPTPPYLRYPHVRDDLVVFVAQDDVWSVPADGGVATRISDDHRPVRTPRLSPDGASVAWASQRGGVHEIHVAPVDGGPARQLTYWGQPRTSVAGWLSPDEVLVLSTTGEAERSRCYAHAVPLDGGPARRLPYGWAHDLVLQPEGPGALLASSTTVEPAWWKHYRGGTASPLWLDLRGDGEFERVFSDLSSSLVGPLWTVLPGGEQRLGFLSDHEGRGALYSAAIGDAPPRTAELVRHTDLEFYPRHASSDGRQVVFVAGGELHLLDSLAPDAAPRRVDVRIPGARASLRPHRISVDADSLGHLSPDADGRGAAVEVRGSIHWLTLRDGPAPTLADGSDVRRRLPVTLAGGRVAWVTDEEGDDEVVVGSAAGDQQPRRLVTPGRAGRILELAAAPDGRRLAIASHDGRLLVVDVPSGEIGRAGRLREVDQVTNGDVSGLTFSPDSRWLAWSAPGPEPLRQIRLIEVGRAKAAPIDVTPLRFTDTEPCFTRDGRHLAFLSVRILDPVYDDVVFDLSFAQGCRPYLVPLAATTPAPLAPVPGGRADEPRPDDRADATVDAPPATEVDLEGLQERLVALPVPGGRYESLRAVVDGLVWRKLPVGGELGAGRATPEAEPERARLERLDLLTGRLRTLREQADAVEVTGRGRLLLVADKETLRLLPADAPIEKDDPRDRTVDLKRLRVTIDPAAEWTQMFHESWRLMRDHFWRADLGGLDWEGVRNRYARLLQRIATRDDLVDLIWETNGELGSSHAYCNPPDDADEPRDRQGLLGADLRYTDGQWRIERIVPGESSEPAARSPLTAPGIAVRPGDAIMAIDGRPTSRTVPPGQLLIGSAGRPVALTVRPRRGSERTVVVVPTTDEMPLRYQDWVAGRRRRVHDATDGRVGYLHVPDMVSGGWAQLHRDLRTEMPREALIVDVRANRGGHTSELVVEKLARRILGWDLSRGYEPASYPGHARRGPMVTVTDRYAGSDGDIVTAAIKLLGLGPVVGTRTWGGVIGIDGRYTLVDGTQVTQPRYSFHFDELGWGVENYGVDPDVEVPATPQDLVAGVDAQLDRAVEIVLDLLSEQPAKQPPELPPV